MTMEPLGERAEFRIYGLVSNRMVAGKEFTAPWRSGDTEGVSADGRVGISSLWEALRLLEEIKLLERVTYVLDGPPGAGEFLLPAGGGEAAERTHAEEMGHTAHHLMTRTERTLEKKGDVLRGHDRLVAVRRHVGSPHAVSVFRPRYLPDTEPNRRWLARLDRWRAASETWRAMRPASIPIATASPVTKGDDDLAF
jgi:hypothetical protein